MTITHQSTLRNGLQAGILVIGMLSGPQAHALADEDLGRLFNTPRHRTQLDELRRRNIPITPPAPQQRSDSIALQGIVRRSSGHSTVWINGSAHQDRAPVQALGDSTARVSLGESKAQELKVGQQLQIRRPPEKTDAAQ